MQSPNPKVSVVIPVHNAEPYLRQCLDSVLAQSLGEIEIICIDDNSTDLSPDLLREYAGRDARLQCIMHDHNVSASQCRKDGVLLARGEYIMFMDADDYLEPNACEAAYNAILTAQVDLLQFGVTVENCADLSEGRIESNQKALDSFATEVLRGCNLLSACFLEKQIGISLWNKIVRASVCKAAFACVEDGFFPKANDLYAAFFLMYHASSFYGIGDRLYHYCFGRGMTGQNVMTLEQFTLHCQSSRVYYALRRWAGQLPEEESASLDPVLEQIKRGFIGEQCGRWRHNLEEESKQQGVAAMAGAWNGNYAIPFGGLANHTYYNRLPVIRYLKDAPFLQYQPREVKTIALYYRSIANGGAQRVVQLLCNLFSGRMQDGAPKYKVLLVTDDPPSEDEYPLSEQVERFLIPHRTSFPGEDYCIRTQAWNELIDRYHVDAVIYSMWVDPTICWDMLTIKSHPSHPAFLIHSHSFCGMMYRLQGVTVEESFSSFAIADGIVTLSRCDRKYWSYVNPRSYCITNPCHFDVIPQENRARFDGKSILWLGRISHEKQPLEIVRIMKHVLREIPDAVCHVVGEGGPNVTGHLIKSIQEAGLSEHIILEGFHLDVGQFYQNASVFMMTSMFEGFSLTIYEAAAYGLPTVTYDLPWLEYYSIFQGWSSVPQRDPEAAARQIVRLLRDREHWQQASDSIYDSFVAYKESDLAGEWERVFNDLSCGSTPVLDALDPQMQILLRQIGRFHNEGLTRMRNEKNRIDKSRKELEARVAALNRDLRRANADRKKLRKKVKSLKSSHAYRIGRLVTAPVRLLRKLMRALRPAS